MNYEMNRRYMTSGLTTQKTPTNGLLLTGIICVIIGVPLIAFYGVGVVPLGLGVLFIILSSNNTNSNADADSEYDAEVRNYLRTINIKQMAMNALGVDEAEVSEIEPIMFDGYCFDGVQYVRLGKDKLYRSNKYRCVFIMFSANEAHVFKLIYDTTKDSKIENTEVYFYKDIVSVSTSSESIDVLGKKFETECFKLTTAGGNALTVSIFDKEGAQRSINAMRALLREKKQA